MAKQIECRTMQALCNVFLSAFCEAKHAYPTSAKDFALFNWPGETVKGAHSYKGGTRIMQGN